MYICIRKDDYSHTAVKAAVPAPSCPAQSSSPPTSSSQLANNMQQLDLNETPPTSSPVTNGSVADHRPVPVQEPLISIEDTPVVNASAPPLSSAPQSSPVTTDSTPNQPFYGAPHIQPPSQPISSQQPGAFRGQDQRRTVSSYPTNTPSSQTTPQRTSGSLSSYPSHPRPAPVPGYGAPYQQGTGSPYPPIPPPQQQPTSYGAPFMQQGGGYPPAGGYNTGYPPSAQYPAAGGYPPAPPTSSYGYGVPSYGAAGAGFMAAPVSPAHAHFLNTYTAVHIR